MFFQIAALSAVYLVRPDQWDPAVAVDLLNALGSKGIAIQRNASGTWVVPDNPYIEPLAVEMGIAVERTNVAQKDVTPVKGLRADGSVHGTGHITTLDHRENAVFIATAFLLDRSEGVSWAADGTVILDSWYAEGFARVDNFSKQFAVRLTLTDDPALKPAYVLRRPRVGLIGEAPWLANLFEQSAVPFTPIPSLTSGFDSIVLVGARPDVNPTSVNPTSVNPYLDFMKAGGTLIVVPSGQGTPATISVEPQPIAFGMPPSLKVFSSQDPVPAASHAIARFADGSPALAEERVGKGRLLVFHFRPQTGTAKLLFNAIYLASARQL
jgi:hypothetical protein